MRFLLIICFLVCSVFGQVYPYGIWAFPAWGGVGSAVVDVSLYYGIEKEREMVIKSIVFDKGIWNYIVYVDWKKVE